MLLKDFRSTGQSKIKVINKFLSENFGATINVGVNLDDLIKAREDLQESITSMKRNGDNFKSDKYSKALLTFQAINTLIESQQERPHKTYRMQLAKMFMDAVNMIDLGDDMEDAIKSVMKEYRSSQYRFPDDEVENDLRNRLIGYMADMEAELNEYAISEAHGEGFQTDMFGIDADLEDKLEQDNDNTVGEEAWCCDECTMGIVNDDYTSIDDEDRYQHVLNSVQQMNNASFADEYEEFSRSPCDCCGTILAGSRHKFILM